MDWSSFVLGFNCSILTANTIVLPTEKRNSELVYLTKEKLRSILKILDDQLEKHEYVSSNNFSLADISIGCWINRCRVLKIDLFNFNNLIRWVSLVDSRVPFQKAVIEAPLPPN